jgi:hypothetical protein
MTVSSLARPAPVCPQSSAPIGPARNALNDALVDVVHQCGGSKEVASLLRPGMPADDAGRWLRDCLNPDRRELLSPERLLALLNLARQRGVHVAMQALGAETGYLVAPIEPELERAKLMREFVEAQRALQELAVRMERLELLKG